MKFKKLVDAAKGYIEEHHDEIVKEVKERAPGIKGDLAELKGIAQSNGTLTDKAKQALETIKGPAKPDEAGPTE